MSANKSAYCTCRHCDPKQSSARGQLIESAKPGDSKCPFGGLLVWYSTKDKYRPGQSLYGCVKRADRSFKKNKQFDIYDCELIGDKF